VEKLQLQDIERARTRILVAAALPALFSWTGMQAEEARALPAPPFTIEAPQRPPST
jgi:hypothetical protein